MKAPIRSVAMVGVLALLLASWQRPGRRAHNHSRQRRYHPHQHHHDRTCSCLTSGSPR